MVSYISGLVFWVLLVIGGALLYPLAQANPVPATLIGIVWLVAAIVFASAIQLAAQWERAVVFRLGKFHAIRGPGLFLIVPLIDQIRKVDTRVTAVDIAKHQVITKDNVPVTINGVLFFRVAKADDAIIRLQDYRHVIAQYAKTSLRDVIGQMTLDQLLAEEEKIAQAIETNVEQDSRDWGLEVIGLRIQDIDMPEDLKKMMSRQASAEREKRATITKAEGDREAAVNLAAAAHTMAESPGAMQLRTLQTIDGLGPTSSNTVVLAVPIEIMNAIRGLDGLLAAETRLFEDGQTSLLPVTSGVASIARPATETVLAGNGGRVEGAGAVGR
jgi:regulator of protease activity HflC (stomatin/prohibitin superfamily)